MSKSPINGFTVVEAVVAITILMVGIIAVANFFPFSLKIIGDSENTSVATNLALSKLEETQAIPYAEIGSGTVEAKHRLSEDVSSYLYAFQRKTTATYVDSDLNTSVTDQGLKRINVTVYWLSSIGNKERSITINSLLNNVQ